MKILILEDDPNRINLFKLWFENEDTVIVHNSTTANNLLDKNKYDFIFLDHDLDGQQFVDSDSPNTGFATAKHIPKTINKDSDIIVHSHNFFGAKNMMEALSGLKATYRPFGTFDHSIILS